MKRRGFTLVELLLVLVVMATLVSLAVPGYQAVLLRSRAAEPRLVLQAIADAQLAYFRDHGRYLAAGPSTSGGKVPTRPVSFDASGPGWSELGIHPDGLVRYRYSVQLAGNSFIAVANGDLDGDGVESAFELRGSNLSWSVRDELE